MTFDLGALADRFRRATERPIVPLPMAPPAPDPGAWLTAEAHPEYPRDTPHGGGVYSNTAGSAPEAAGGGPPATGPSSPPGSHSWPTPEGPTSRRRPRRRRWLPPSSPSERRQEAVDQAPARYRCPMCGGNHQPIRLDSGGVFAPYRRVLAPDPWAEGRPRPLGQDEA